MNPAALKMNIADLKPNGILIVNLDDFARNRSAQSANDLESARRSFARQAIACSPSNSSAHARRPRTIWASTPSRVDRCKNFFALGMCYWLYNRSMETTLRWIDEKFKNKPQLVEANQLAMQAGYSYCEATEAFQISYEIPPAKLTPGLYRNMSGNQALAMGFVAASQKCGLAAFPGQLSDHAGVRYFARAFAIQRFRRNHISGRRRNRRHHFGDRRGLRRRAGTHHHFRPRHGAQNRSAGPGRCRRNSAGHLRHSARRPVHRFADENRASRPVAGALRPQLRSSHSQYSRRPLPATASGSPSKPPASPSSTWSR